METLKLRVKFMEKSREDGDKIYFTFISQLNFVGRENPKVVKALEDFKTLSKIVKAQAAK